MPTRTAPRPFGRVLDRLEQCGGEAHGTQNGLESGAAYWEAGWDWIAARRKVSSAP